MESANSTPDLAPVEQKKMEPLLFSVLWDEALGPTILEVAPNRPQSLDIEGLAIQLFMTLQTVFGTDPDKPFKALHFLFPLAALEIKAKLRTETIPNPGVRGGLQPLLIILLLPDVLPDKTLTKFDPILDKCAMQCRNKQSNVVSGIYPEITTLFIAEQSLVSNNIIIPDDYSITAAIEDFKAGVNLFQQKQFDTAYPMIRKAGMKFEKENQDKLHLEAKYLVATILLQEGRFSPAIDAYNTVKELAIRQNHIKYKEIAQFMIGFSLYKTEDYAKALPALDLIDIGVSQFVNKIQFYTIRGRICRKLELFDRSIEEFKSVLEQVKNIPDANARKKQQAQIYNELGQIYYQASALLMRTKPTESAEQVHTNLLNAIDAFKKAADLWESFNDYANLISLYPLIAQIYRFLNNIDDALKYYGLGLEIANAMNQSNVKIRIMKYVIQIQSNQNMWEKNIEQLQLLLNNLRETAFVDNRSIAELRGILAENYIKTQNFAAALDEYLITLNVYNRLETPVPEKIEVLDKIIEIYEKIGQADKKEYYLEQREKTQQQLQKLQPAKIIRTRLLGDIKECWIYYETGCELFSYAPETAVNTDLLGGFLSAMQSFSKEISQKELNSMTIGEDKYVFYREPNWRFFILGRTNSKTPHSVINAILKKIFTRFCTLYEPFLRDFGGNVSPFMKFKHELETMDFNLLTV